MRDSTVTKALIRWARRFADYLEATLTYGGVRCKRCKHALVVCQSAPPCKMVRGEQELGTAGRFTFTCCTCGQVNPFTVNPNEQYTEGDDDEEVPYIVPPPWMLK
jgi:hypothetical protein